MKSENPIPRKSGVSHVRRGTGTHMPAHMPMEWMDPLSWRLPSGQALAEFALQTGFLAPLMMRAPQLKRKSPLATAPVGLDGMAGKSEESVGEAPARLPSFRHNR